MLFLWLKAFHIIAIVCWFAALFYLPRLFVYHAAAEDEIGQERFKVMERKLYKGIANPSMMLSVILGIAMVFTDTGKALVMSGGWFHVKMLLLAVLIVYHILCQKHMLALAEGRNNKTHVYFRFFNEFPVLILISMVVLVVVKPF